MTPSPFISQLFGTHSLNHFLKKYWQRRPLFVKNAVDPRWFEISKTDLRRSCADENVESRLVRYRHSQWELQTGAPTKWPREKTNWTVLVQGANLHFESAHQLLNQFRFLPQVRLDDVMISYAVAGGGVGAHFDSYDVFLLQAQGRRRWRISNQTDLRLKPDLPLKILENFQPEQEFICEPGDLLYLPPHYAHEGTALDECMTYSVGFRVPSYQEITREFYARWSDFIETGGRYKNAEETVTKRPGEIPQALLQQATKTVLQHVPRQTDIHLFLGEWLSEPKAHISFTPRKISFARFMAQTLKHDIALDRRSLMLYRNKLIFLNGESYRADKSDRKILMQLADQKFISSALFAKANSCLQEQIHAWYNDGWIQLIPTHHDKR